MKTTKILMILIMTITSLVFAKSPFQANAHFSLGFPQNEFADNLDAIGAGGGGSFLYRIPQTGISVGAGIDFYIYGSETRKEPWSMTIPDIYLDVTRTNSIFQGFLMLHIQPKPAKFNPYAEGLFGFNYLSTSTSVKSENRNDEDDEIASSTNYEDSALLYGGGAGLLFRVFKSPESIDPADKDLSVFIDLGFRYLNGGEASYLKKGDIEIDNGKVQYHAHYSATDLLTFNLGVSFIF